MIVLPCSVSEAVQSHMGVGPLHRRLCSPPLPSVVPYHPLWEPKLTRPDLRKIGTHIFLTISFLLSALSKAGKW